MRLRHQFLDVGVGGTHGNDTDRLAALFPANQVRVFEVLLELLLALAIFGLLAVMSYGGLRTVLDQQAHTDAEAERLAALQKTYLIMQRDIEQTVPRPVRDEFGDVQLALAGSNVLQLTRGGWSNPAGHARSTLQRVGYAREDLNLVRYVWPALDRAQDSEPLQQQLAGHIEHMELRYLDASNEWQLQWPKDEASNPADAPPPKDLPKAVEVRIEHEHYGPLVWLFQLPY